jgi:hypothetical protein
LKAQGQITKANGSTDQLVGNPAPLTPSIDRIVGVSGLRNAIDGRISGPTTTTFKIDLAKEFLNVSVLSQPFQVANFVDVIGTANDDSIEGNDAIIGGLSNIFFGQAGEDTLQGVDETAAKPGVNELDLLFGGFNSDLYLVGDNFAGDYYLSDNIPADPFGNDDFALIFDFELFSDRLNLSGANPYVFQGLPGSGPLGLAGIDIYADIGTLPASVDQKDDLITRVLFNAPLILATPPASSSLTAASSGDNLSTTTLADESLDFTQLETIEEAVKLALDTSSRFDKFVTSDISDISFTFDNLPKELTSIFSESTTEFAIA